MAELTDVLPQESEGFQLFVPFTKIEETERGLIIEGVATAELEDLQGEIVDYEASKAAFAQAAPVNIREQHDPNKAVGVELSHICDDVNRRVTLRALISSGARDTIAKIRDKVLRGFSIGGQAKEKTVESVPLADGGSRQRKRIGKYALSECSVVDRPALPQAVFCLVKSEGGHLVCSDGVSVVDDLRIAKSPGVTLDRGLASEAFGRRMAELQVGAGDPEGEEVHDVKPRKRTTPADTEESREKVDEEEDAGGEDWEEDMTAKSLYDGEIAKALGTANKNDLPDSDFAYISPGGEKDEEGKTKPRDLRHYPLKQHGKWDRSLLTAARVYAAKYKNKLAQRVLPKIKEGYRALGMEWDTEKSVAGPSGLRKFSRGAYEARRALKEGILVKGQWLVVSKQAASAAEGGADLLDRIAKLGALEVETDEDATAEDVAAAIEGVGGAGQDAEEFENVMKGLATDESFELSEEDLAKAFAPALEAVVKPLKDTVAKLAEDVKTLAGQPEAKEAPVIKEQPRTAAATTATGDPQIEAICKRMGSPNAQPEELFHYGQTLRERERAGESLTYQERKDADAIEMLRLSRPK